MVDDLDDLGASNPAMGMKDEVVDALFLDNHIQRDLHVAHSVRIVWLLHMLRSPVARYHAGEFPAGTAN